MDRAEFEPDAVLGGCRLVVLPRKLVLVAQSGDALRLDGSCAQRVLGD